MANVLRRLDLLRPRDQAHVGDATLVARPTLPVRKRGVERPRPTRAVVVVRLRRTELVDVGKRRFRRVGHAVEEPPLVERAVRSTLAAGSVVRHHDDQGVVELPRLLQVVEHATELVVGVGDEPCEHLGHAGEETPLVVVERIPGTHRVEDRPGLAVRTGAGGLTVWVDRRQLGVVGKESELLLLREDPLADGFVALVELALVLVGPLLEHLVWRVPSPWREVHEERLVGIDHLGGLDHPDRLVGQILRQVVPVLRCAGSIDLAVVLDEVGIPLVGFATEEPVEPLEAAPQGPAALVRSEVALLTRCEMPLPDAVRVVPALDEHLGDESVLERNPGRDTREPRTELGDGGHTVARRVATGQQRRPRRRAQRRRVEVREADPHVGNPAHVRRLDGTTEDIHRAVADIVPSDVQDVGSTLGCLRRKVRRPVGHRVTNVERDLAVVSLRHDVPL